MAVETAAGTNVIAAAAAVALAAQVAAMATQDRPPHLPVSVILLTSSMVPWQLGRAITTPGAGSTPIAEDSASPAAGKRPADPESAEFLQKDNQRIRSSLSISKTPRFRTYNFVTL